jgi:aryl-alcohol dehydrogenase-like predicted oxidoreductase
MGMTCRALGRTGLQVSPFTLGTMGGQAIHPEG